MNLDDLIDGKVDVNALPEIPKKGDVQTEVPDIEKLLGDTHAVNPNLGKKSNEPLEPLQVNTPDVPKPVPVSAPVAAPVPELASVSPSPSTPVLGYVTESQPSAYAAKPIPGADYIGADGQSRQLVKDFTKLTIIAGLLFGTVLVAHVVFGVDLPGVKGSDNPPVTWFKTTTTKPATPAPTPVAKVVPVPVTPAPVVLPAPAEAAPAPFVMTAPAEAATVETPPPVVPAPEVKPAQPQTASKAAPVTPEVQHMNLPPPPPPVMPDTPVAHVEAAKVAHDAAPALKKSSVPKKVFKAVQSADAQPGSLEYAEQQMKQFTQQH